jgi:lipopolysaccharide transport system ATP-binding protein
MGDTWSIRAEGLSKKFGRSLKRSMRYGLIDSFNQITGRKVEQDTLREGEFWAVRDVSFELNRGDSLGIMGVNGSGKSTLLRVLTGVYRPDIGRVSLRGTAGALIAAGAGFAPMLTGRENIFVNGALLGMRKKEIESRVDEIIAFAELEGFLDMPVKNYSSGMVVRLGFAIAAMSEPEILIVDEVLAVGDINFQKKCYDYLFRLKRNGTTIVLVSHSIGAIWAVCDKGLFMRSGEAAVLGSVEDVVKAYDEDNARASLVAAAKANAKAVADGADAPPDATGNLSSAYGAQRGGTGAAEITSIEVLDANGDVSPEIAFKAGMKWRLKLIVREPIPDPMIRLAIDAMHYRFISVIDSAEQGMGSERIEPGEYEVLIDCPVQNFRPGGYKVNCAVLSKHAGVHLFYWFGVTGFMIRQPPDRLLFADDQAIIHLDTTFRLT